MSKLISRFAYSVVLLLFVGTSVHLAEIKPPSCDEIFSYYHSKGGDYNQFWDQTKSGFNRMPPLYFLFCKIFFSSEIFLFQARLFSLFTALLSIFYLYKIASIWLDENLGFLLPLSLLTCASTFQEYAIDARPYSLCFLLCVLFVYRILKFEAVRRKSKIEKFYLFALCLLLPSSHYLYGLTALFVGIAHVHFTRFGKFEVLKIYILSGIIFVILHLAIFIEQQQFGNLLAMISYPTFEVIEDYIIGFIATPVLIIIVILWLAILFKSKKSLMIKESSLILLPLCFSLIICFLIGVFLARVFPESMWVLPRYYLGTLLVFPLFFTFLFSMLQQEKKVVQMFSILTLLFTVGTLAKNYKHKKYYYENESMHSYQRQIPVEIRDSELPIYTKDIILFFHYIYEGKKIYYIRDAPELLSKIRKFVPNYTKYILKESEIFLPSIFINIGKGTPNLDGKIKFNPLSCNVGPIHSAYKLE